MQLSERIRGVVGVGGAYFFVFPRNLGQNPYSMSKRGAFGLSDAHLEMDLLPRDDENAPLTLKTGIFPYKYNPDAQNLGEYMFRTWTYPTIITTGGLNLVGSAGAQLSGLDFHSKTGMITNDLLLTVQTDRPPVLSLSLTDIVSVNLGILELGAGLMFDNFYNPVEKQATPKSLPNAYVTLVSGTQMAIREYTDLTSQGLIPAADTTIDTSYYSLSGQKAMLRASLNFGKLLPGDWVSPNDLTLYFEATLMGIKNYPTYYTKQKDRTALMVGFNIPTFKVLDLLSAEVEYCSNPFANTTRGPLGEGKAVPYVEEPPTDQFPAFHKVTRDDIKWSILAKKEIVSGFSVNLQVANDHLKMLDVYSTPDFYDFLVQPNHWYWVVNLSYSI